MLVANGSYNKLVPILAKITNPLRNALSIDSNETFPDTLSILQTVIYLNLIKAFRSRKREA